MSVRTKFFLSVVSAALSVAGVSASPALAQAAAAASFAPGAQIKDTQGGDVGTIARVDGDHVIVKTDRHEVRLPQTSFTAHQGHFLMAMTRDQLNAEVDKALAAANAKLVVGATVNGSAGSPVGTIDAIDAQFVTLKLTSGSLVRLPRSGIAAGPNGGVIGMTAEQLQAQVGAAAEAPAAEAEAEGEGATE